MIFPGLVSVTFRQLSPAEIVTLAHQAELRGIEWGGDIHAPPGDLNRARQIKQLCDAAGIDVVSYGSYYRAGGGAGETFQPVLDTALALGAPNIRVWAGNTGSADASEAERNRVRDDLRRIVELAAAAQVRISLEFHSGTVADTPAATADLIARVDHPGLHTYWQPPVGQPATEAADGLRVLVPHLSHVHVFHWWPDPKHRLPLHEGADRWSSYLELARQAPGDRFAMLEFVPRDDPNAFLEDARTLRTWLAPTTDASS